MNCNATMKSLPQSEQPYERALRNGIDALSDAELISVIIRNGAAGHSALQTAYDILNSLHGLEGLYNADQSSLENIKGIGKVKMLQLMAVGELSKRIWRQRQERDCRLSDSDSIYACYCEEMRLLNQEEVWLLFLDGKLRRIRDTVVTRGTVNCSLVSPRDIFRLCLQNNATCFVLMHNHPSGDSKPSRDDITLTEEVRKLGEMLQLPMIDHIVFGDGNYYSFQRNYYQH